MAKRVDAAYELGRRSSAWLKLKLQHEQEFVVGGYTEPQGARQFIGALVLGYFDGRPGAETLTRASARTRAGRADAPPRHLTYAGLCGGGFTQAALRSVYERLRPLARSTPPFVDPPQRTPTPPHWVQPQIVVQVRFNEWTTDGRLRQPIYLGMRDDKDPRDVHREPDSLEAS